MEDSLDEKIADKEKMDLFPCSIWEVHPELTVFLFSYQPLFLLNNRQGEHLVAVISQTKLFFTLAVSPPKHFFLIKGGPKQHKQGLANILQW